MECRHCGEADVELVPECPADVYNPDAYWQCPVCDSTYNLWEYEAPPKEEEKEGEDDGG